MYECSTRTERMWQCNPKYSINEATSRPHKWTHQRFFLLRMPWYGHDQIKESRYVLYSSSCPYLKQPMTLQQVASLAGTSQPTRFTSVSVATYWLSERRLHFDEIGNLFFRRMSVCQFRSRGHSSQGILMKHGTRISWFLTQIFSREEKGEVRPRHSF